MGFEILVTETNYKKETLDLLGRLGNLKMARLSQEELKETIATVEILFLRLGLVLDKKTIQKATNLKIVGSPTTGLDHLDLPTLEARGITVVSLMGEQEFLSQVRSTAELTFALLLSLLRKVGPNSRRVLSYQWNRDEDQGVELFQKQMGIVGFGRLGRLVSGYAKAFGMEVVASDPRVSCAEIKSFNVKPVSMDELLEESDFISVHASLGENSSPIITSREFSLMKPQALLINTARGQLVCEMALLQALKERRIAGAALDVLAEENQFQVAFSHHPLVEYARSQDNLLITPHVGGMAKESVEKTRHFVANKIYKMVQEQ